MAKKKAEVSAVAPDVQHDVLLAELQAIVDDERDPRAALQLIRRRLELEPCCCAQPVERAPIGRLRHELAQPYERFQGQVDPNSGAPQYKPVAVAEGAEAKPEPILTTDS